MQLVSFTDKQTSLILNKPSLYLLKCELNVDKFVMT